MNPDGDFDPKLLNKLNPLKNQIVRDPVKTSIGRAKFLQEARELKLGVSPNEESRHNGWFNLIKSMFYDQRKEFSPMVNTIAAIVLIVSFVLGGGGITVAAAQNSQPDDLLYKVKLISEDLRLEITSNPETQYQIALDFAARRVEEIKNSISLGEMPSDAVLTRYQNQVEQAIRYALNLPDDKAVLALEQVQSCLQIQEQALLQIQANGFDNTEALLLQTRTMVQTRLQWVETGLGDPSQLRDQIRLRDQDREREQTCTGTPIVMGTKTITGDGNPWTTGTPTPGSGYGPGPGPEPSCTCTPRYGQETNQPTQQPNKPTDAGPNPTQMPNQPTDSGPHITPQPNQPTASQPQPEPTKKPGGGR